MPLPPSEGLRILVADDEAPARQRIIDLLRNNPQVTEDQLVASTRRFIDPAPRP